MNVVERDLLATLDRLRGTLRSCRRLNLKVEADEVERDLCQARLDLLTFHQQASEVSSYVECSFPAGVQLADYRNRGAA